MLSRSRLWRNWLVAWLRVAFSPVTVSDGSQNWYGLGPVSVLPEYQRRGIGKALIQEGVSILKGLSAQGCCLVGDPEYYKRLGFKHTTGLVHEGVPQEVSLVLPFDGDAPQGTVLFHEGFKADGQHLQGFRFSRGKDIPLVESPLRFFRGMCGWV
jgi:predicted N-acetyltransferase YhbS